MSYPTTFEERARRRLKRGDPRELVVAQLRRSLAAFYERTARKMQRAIAKQEKRELEAAQYWRRLAAIDAARERARIEAEALSL